MTAKKKRKKLINSIYHGVPRDPVVHLSERCAQMLPPPWPRLPGIVFDVGPDPDVKEPPGGEYSFKATTTSTLSTGLGGDVAEDFFVTEETLEDLNPGFERFVTTLFGASWRSEVAAADIACLTFTSRVGSVAMERVIEWQVVRWRDTTLYVNIESAAFPEGSKSSFVQLLDYAEEELSCENVVICYPMDHGHRDAIVKTFMFLGFFLLQPGHPLIQLGGHTSDRYMFMGYIIE